MGERRAMTVGALRDQLAGLPADMEIVLSGDPGILGDGATTVRIEVAPRLNNITVEAGDAGERVVVMWPDRCWEFSDEVGAALAEAEDAAIEE